MTFRVQCFVIALYGLLYGLFKMTVKITQKNLPSLPDGVYGIEPNFYVRVREGKINFFFSYTKDGKRKQIALGGSKRTTLALAKEKAAKLRLDLMSGNKPTLKEKEVPVAKDAGRTFNEIYKEAIETMDGVKRWKNEKHRRQWYSTIEAYACPVLGNMKIKDISRDDIIAVLKPIWNTKNETASRVRARLERIFSYAIFKHEYMGANPAVYRDNLDMVFAPSGKIQTVKHMEAMTIKEAQKYVAIALASGTMGHLATVFGMLTALRANEFIRARWEEIDLKEALWTIPPERRKIARDFPMRVPLSTQACAILEHLAREYKGEGAPKGFVFSSDLAEKGHLSLETPRVILRKTLKRAVTMHGCRSTFRDWAEETGQNPTATERCLMHEEPNKTTRAYQRSDLLEKRRPLMQAWADAIFPRILAKQFLEQK